MTPEFYGNIGMNWGLIENLIANVSLNYVGERKRSEEMTWQYDEPNDKWILARKDKRDPVDERWLLNASLTFKDFLTKEMAFQISGFNLSDDDHRDPDADGNVANDLSRPGVTFMGRISYSF